MVLPIENALSVIAFKIDNYDQAVINKRNSIDLRSSSLLVYKVLGTYMLSSAEKSSCRIKLSSVWYNNPHNISRRASIHPIKNNTTHSNLLYTRVYNFVLK